jgi:hypothetical protein
MGQTFQSFWFGDSITPYEAVCMRSFVDHGHDFHLYTFNTSLVVPDGVELRDASEFAAEGEYFTYQSGPGVGSHAAFSNLFRYLLLAKRGGWWVDTDVVCLTDAIPAYDTFFALERDDIVNGAVLRFAAGDPLIDACLSEASRIRDRATWGMIGPLLITRCLTAAGRMCSAKPASVCYPVAHASAVDILLPEKRSALSGQIAGSQFLHLWNEVLRRSNIDKHLLPPAGSLMRRFTDRHPVDGWRGEYDAAALGHILRAEAELKKLRDKCQKLDARVQSLQAHAPKRVRLKTRVRSLGSRVFSLVAGH